MTKKKLKRLLFQSSVIDDSKKFNNSYMSIIPICQYDQVKKGSFRKKNILLNEFLFRIYILPPAVTMSSASYTSRQSPNDAQREPHSVFLPPKVHSSRQQVRHV